MTRSKTKDKSKIIEIIEEMKKKNISWDDESDLYSTEEDIISSSEEEMILESDTTESESDTPELDTPESDEPANKKMKLMEEELFKDEEKTSNIPFKLKILTSSLKDDIKKTIITYVNDFNRMSKCSSDYNKMASWMNTLEKIPFDTYIDLPVSFNSTDKQITSFLKNLQYNLNNCIYGQEEAKESILQIITQNITNPSGGGSIIALKGPPGVGKTTLIKNGLSKALNLPFAFISLSGVNDMSYLDGFSYTYEGSRYGKIVDILIKKKCMNPILFFDELDKVSCTEKGNELINLLIHLTDFSQNDHFEDKYFSGIPLNLSRVIYIFSLNYEEVINPILKDRLNIVKLKEFNIKQKISITKDYILPELIKVVGIKEDIIFTDEIISHIIKTYACKEQGVRELKRCIQTIFRRINVLKYSEELKLNYSIKGMSFPYTLSIKDIDELLKDKKTEKNISHAMMYL